MFSVPSYLCLLLCSLVAWSQCNVSGPRPFDVSIRTKVTHPGHDGHPQPPGTGGEEEVGPVPPFGMGDRCPFPPDENGEYPYYCVQFIGDDCECIYDDIHIPQKECVLNNRTEYEVLAGYQMEQEKEIDKKRVEMGELSQAEPYFHVLECLDKVDTIIGEAKKKGEEVDNDKESESVEDEEDNDDEDESDK